MPDANSQIQQAGAITKALLDALDQIERYVAASQIGPDGKPLGSAVYMHMPMGYPVDPKMFANAWTPGGGSHGSDFSNDGTFIQPAAAPATQTAVVTNGSGPDGAVFPPPPQPDAKLAESIQAAFFTAQLVDNMLEVTKNGVALSWPDRKVSVEYYTILEGMQPLPQDHKDPAVEKAVKAATELLYIKDDKGNFVGYTPLYAQYRRNCTALADATAAYATAYAQALVDPVAGQQWPLIASTYANKKKQALDDLNGMGRRQVEAALDTLATQGQTAAAALVALARQLYEAYAVQLAGGVATKVPWSYISPISWWDYKNRSFGVQTITASSSSFSRQTGSGAHSFASNWWNEHSSSTSGSIRVGLPSILGASGGASHSEAANAFGNHDDSYNWHTASDTSSSATVKLEFFVATIERPWLLGDVFHIDGWYLVGQRKNAISDGTVEGQLGGDTKSLLPMIPKAFVIIRNVSITCNDWGDSFSQLNQHFGDTSGSGESSSTSASVSASYLWFAGASGSHSEQEAGGAFQTQSDSKSIGFAAGGGRSGTLTLSGSQICGWIGEIQPAAPRMDDPTLPKSDKH